MKRNNEVVATGVAALIIGFLWVVVSLLLTVTMYAALIYGVLWVLEAVFNVGLLTAIKDAVG